jgi:hypothetical protein
MIERSGIFAARSIHALEKSLSDRGHAVRQSNKHGDFHNGIPL